MKNKRKIISFILVLALIVSSYTSVFAAASSLLPGAPRSSTADKAALLNNLRLYNGTSTTGFTPDLESQLNRETGIVMLIRLLGMETDAQAMTDEETTAALSKFSDSSSVSPWARKAVALAVQQELVSGMPGGTLGPKSSLTGNQYSTLLLRSLGYTTSNFEMSTNELLQLQSLQNKHNEAFEIIGSSALTKALLVNMSFDSLQLHPKNDLNSLIEILISNGVVSRDAAVNGGLVSNLPVPKTGSSSSNHNDTTPTFTVTAASIHAGGDNVTLNFATAMTTHLPYALYYHDTPSGTKTPIHISSASTAWSNGNKTLTITLNEEMDEAYIPKDHYISAIVTGTAVNGLTTTTSAVCTSDKISGENVAPQLASWELNMHGRLLSLRFNEFVVSGSSLDVADITLKATAATTTSTHALTTSTVTNAAILGSYITIALSNADYSAITAASIGISAGSSFIDLTAGAVQDLVGNSSTPTSGLAITSPDFIPDYPELTEASGVSNTAISGTIATGDAIMLNFTKAVSDVFNGCTVHVEGSQISILSSTSAILVTIDSLGTGQDFCSGGSVDFSCTRAYSGNEVVITLDSLISGSGTLQNLSSPTFPRFSLYPAVTDLSGNGWSSSVMSDISISTY